MRRAVELAGMKIFSMVQDPEALAAFVLDKNEQLEIDVRIITLVCKYRADLL